MFESETIWDERSALERLVRMLPGYRGYHVAENRREADALFRSFGRARLDRVRSELEQLGRRRTGRASGPYHGLARRLAALCEQLESESHPRLRRSLVSTRAASLDPVYARDEEIVRSVVALSVAIYESDTRPEDFSRELSRIEHALAQRHQLIDELLH